MVKKVYHFLTRSFGGDTALNTINRSSDVLLAVWVIAVIVMIILPVPPAIIDLLITFNLTAAVGLLMVALYIPSAIHLSMFPSLLLITTLFRLGVSISATRQILLHAYAGEIISALCCWTCGLCDYHHCPVHCSDQRC